MIKIALPNGKNIEFEKISRYGEGLTAKELEAVHKRRVRRIAAAGGIGAALGGAIHGGGPIGARALRALLYGTAGAGIFGTLKHMALTAKLGPEGRKKLEHALAKSEAREALKGY